MTHKPTLILLILTSLFISACGKKGEPLSPQTQGQVQGQGQQITAMALN